MSLGAKFIENGCVTGIVRLKLHLLCDCYVVAPKIAGMMHGQRKVTVTCGHAFHGSWRAVVEIVKTVERLEQHKPLPDILVIGH